MCSVKLLVIYINFNLGLHVVSGLHLRTNVFHIAESQAGLSISKETINHYSMMPLKDRRNILWN